MPNETDNPETPNVQDGSTKVEKELEEKLNNIANKAAQRAGNREKRYNGGRGIFTW